MVRAGSPYVGPFQLRAVKTGRLKRRMWCRFGLGEELAASLEQPWPRIIVDIAPHCVSHSGASCGAAIFLSLLQVSLQQHVQRHVSVYGG